MCRFLVPEIPALHRVAGHDNVIVAQHSSTPGSSSETSLQLKPDKSERLPPLKTPSKTEGSEQASLGRAPDGTGSMEDSSLRSDIAVPLACPQNDLDKAIEEARVTKDLVSVGKYGHAINS